MAAGLDVADVVAEGDGDELAAADGDDTAGDEGVAVAEVGDVVAGEGDDVPAGGLGELTGGDALLLLLGAGVGQGEVASAWTSTTAVY